jgi:hypothetical protein
VDPFVARTPTEIPCQGRLHLLSARLGMVTKQRPGGDDDAWGAGSALHAPVTDEALQECPGFAGGDAFHRLDCRLRALDQRHQTGEHRLAFE